MSLSGSAMTLSSSTSQGKAPASGKTMSAMPKKANDPWSEGSSAGGSRGGVDFFHEALKKFDEQSRGSGSLDDNGQAPSSSENASMTKGEMHGPQGPMDSLPKRIAAEAKAKAFDLMKQAMPSLMTFAGMGRSAASSSQGPQTPLLPMMSAAPREQATKQSQDHQPMAADQSSDSGNTIPYKDQNKQVHGGGGDAAFMDK